LRECSNICDLCRDYRSNPIAAIFRGGAKLSLRASSRFKKLMRPTGEAFGPVSGDFVYRLL